MLPPNTPHDCHRPSPGDSHRMDARSPSAPTGHIRRLNSAELLGSAQEIEIKHGDAVYRMRLTALGKLILTK